eukprot:Phypoly_transcript_15606.p1 GENE.Phypoly_transcript_15606~~Phypoly_transcript_15606.p1  ORF type:complete len:304 (+),score=94.21 Phypoly_transcript_15606:120-914(+)
MNGVNALGGSHGVMMNGTVGGMANGVSGVSGVSGMRSSDSAVSNAVLNGTIDPNTFNIYANGSAPNSTLTPPHLNGAQSTSAARNAKQQKSATATNPPATHTNQFATTAKSASAPSLHNDDPGIDIDPYFDFSAEFDAARLSKDPFYSGGIDDEAGEEDDDDDEYVEEKKNRKTAKGKNAEKGKGGMANGTGGKRGVKRAAKPAKGPTPAMDPGTLIGDDVLAEYGANVATPELSEGMVVKRKRGRPPGSGRGKKKKVVDPNYE